MLYIFHVKHFKLLKNIQTSDVGRVQPVGGGEGVAQPEVGGCGAYPWSSRGPSHSGRGTKIVPERRGEVEGVVPGLGPGGRGRGLPVVEFYMG